MFSNFLVFRQPRQLCRNTKLKIKKPTAKLKGSILVGIANDKHPLHYFIKIRCPTVFRLTFTSTNYIPSTISGLADFQPSFICQYLKWLNWPPVRRWHCALTETKSHFWQLLLMILQRNAAVLKHGFKTVVVVVQIREVKN